MKRKRTELKKIKNLKGKLLAIAALGAYVIILLLLDISCPIKAVTGINCPGCGMTRAMIRLIHFDISGAFSYHRMFFSVPILFMYFLYDGKLFKNKILNNTVLIAIALGFVINWIRGLICGIGG